MARLGPGRVVVECSEGLAALLAPCRRADAPGRPPAAGPDGVAGARLDEFLQVMFSLSLSLSLSLKRLRLDEFLQVRGGWSNRG